MVFNFYFRNDFSRVIIPIIIPRYIKIFPIGINPNGSISLPSTATSDPMILKVIMEEIPNNISVIDIQYFFIT